MTSERIEPGRPGNEPKLRALAAAAVLAVPLWISAAPAAAQNPEIQNLLNRVDRLQRELTTLQRQFHRNGVKPLPSAPAETGKAAARGTVRLSLIENELRRLTGSMEELGHELRQLRTGRMEELGQELRQLRARLDRIEADRQPATESRAAAAPGAAAPRPPGVPRPAPPGRKGKASTAHVPPTPKEQYDTAVSLMLQKQDFAGAEKILRAFLKRNPKHSLASNAHYYLGETHFVRKNYRDAARAYGKGFEQFPKGAKAAESLLKLGVSLARLDKRPEACTAYSALLTTFPKASKRLKAQVKQEQGRAECQ